ncbi:MAG TPA: S6e family ribosomal protein [Candidatus Bilamarchaeaceae archaeon]|nr:S6e family ribosomal protein [Candidatus Bilamarchaeaceae archaeon]
MRVVISDPKTGKSYQKEIPAEQDVSLVGKKIGEKIDGGLFGAAGYTLEFTGGSDKSGFPMRRDVVGARKGKILLTKGVGFKTKGSKKKKKGEGKKILKIPKGQRRRKMVHGNTFSAEIMQVNCKVTTWGASPLDQLFPKTEKKS